MIKPIGDVLIKEARGGRQRRLRALIVKEFFQIIKDPSSWLISVFLPLLLIFLYAYGVSLDLDHLKIGLVLEDTSPNAQSLRESFTNSPYFEAKVGRDRREFINELIKGSIRGIVIIPSYFTQFINRSGTVAPIQVIADGSETNTANFVQNYARGAFEQWLLERKIIDGPNPYLKSSSLVRVEPRYWYNETLESRFFLLSGSFAIIMTLTGALLTALVVAKEWERGTMEMMISTTVGISELVFGKVIPYFALGMLSMLLCVSISTLFFNLPLRGSFFLLMFISAIFLVTSLSLGLMISTLLKNQIAAYQLTVIVAYFPAYILSGFLFEISSMPHWVRVLTHFMPAKYFVESLQALFLVGNVWRLVLINMIPMIIIALIFFGITFLKTAKRLD